MYVYIRTEPRLFTVGHYSPDGEFHPDSDHGTREEAAAQVARLNGGPSPELLEQVADLAKRLEELEIRAVKHPDPYH